MFGDTTTAAQVAKALGKKVRGYQAETWKNACVTIMKTGLTAKISQNPKLFYYYYCFIQIFTVTKV